MGGFRGHVARHKAQGGCSVPQAARAAGSTYVLSRRTGEIPQLLGEITEHPEAWEEATPINLIPQLGNGDLAIVFDCGYDDFFFEVNNDFHDELLRRGIMHDFYVPGGHTGTYWGQCHRLSDRILPQFLCEG